MYIIFFHLTGIALLEIVFYFTYVGHMETDLFGNTISNLLKSEENKIEYFKMKNPYNESEYIVLQDLIENNSSEIIDYYKKKSKESEKERNEHNDELFKDAMLVWMIIFFITMLIFALEIYYMYCRKGELKKNDSVSNMTLEMVEQTNLGYNYNERSFNSNESEIVNEEEYCSKNIKKKILSNLFHCILLASLILGFEFWFFNYIIMDYQIISKEELEYLFVSKSF
tara:strand:+ start:485 stop:1162 length:678 start_codon:yes stop_codon:yes gene_type:complete